MKNIFIGLLALMLANIILDITFDSFKNEFSLKKLLKIVSKTIIILVSSALIYYCGYLNPSIVVVSLNGIEMNLVDSLKMIYITAIIYYGYGDIKKLSEFLGNSKIEISPIETKTLEEDPYPIIEIPEKNGEEIIYDEVKG